MRALRQRIRPQAVGNVDKQVADHLLFDTLHAQVPGTPCHRRNQGTAQGTTHSKAKSKGPGHRQNKGSSTATLLRRLLRLDDRQDTAQGLRTGSLHPRSAEKHARTTAGIVKSARLQMQCSQKWRNENHASIFALRVPAEDKEIEIEK